MNPVQSRMARAALGWTIVDLARAADVSTNTVNRFESGNDARRTAPKAGAREVDLG
jgi:transcriptional regulator with XRE-family HTH domain